MELAKLNWGYKHVGFSFCLIFNEITNILFNRIHFPRSQAFASPSDMASSGVWENVFLVTTPLLMVYVECYGI